MTPDYCYGGLLIIAYLFIFIGLTGIFYGIYEAVGRAAQWKRARKASRRWRW